MRGIGASSGATAQRFTGQCGFGVEDTATLPSEALGSGTLGPRRMASAYFFIVIANTRKHSATLHAWAKQPSGLRGRWGESSAS